MRYGSDEGAFEVFAQFGHGRDVCHVGSVRGADAELAWHAAKEIYTRRERCTQLWVVPRTAMLMSDTGDADVLMASQRMPFRKPAFPGGLRRARAKAAEAGER
jgi:ring-1,2-phenylacetyl-CoA epoxidase subunit PaaB